MEMESYFLRPQESLSPVRCVAVLPFDNLTRYPSAGEIAADLLSVELFRSRKFNVMERSEVERIFMTRGIVPPPSVDVIFAVEAGRLLGVEGVFAGTVSEYYYRKTSRATREEEPVVGMAVRFIDVASSHMLWMGSVSKVSGSVFLAMKEPINKVAQEAVEGLLTPLCDAVPFRDVDPRTICWTEAGKLLLTVSAPPSPAPSKSEVVPRITPASLAVLNGSGVPKAGENIAKRLLLSDLNLVSVGNAKTSGLETSVILYHTGLKDQAEKLAALLPQKVRVEMSNDYTWDITVIVGKDLAGR